MFQIQSRSSYHNVRKGRKAGETGNNFNVGPWREKEEVIHSM